ncbi:lysM domain-containing protein [Ditylenchus destructor]|nr:lysM domain-containing protein [Ditylenchus destructor]
MENYRADNDEYTFLIHYQKIRRYGSTSDLNAPSPSHQPKYNRIIVHTVEPGDTLQSLELKYNSSMCEIKRLNRLWSNDSLYCKTHVNIPIFDSQEDMISPGSTKSQPLPLSPEDVKMTFGEGSKTDSKKISADALRRHHFKNGKLRDSSCSAGGPLGKLEETEAESLDQLFKRIDKNVKKSQKVVKKLNKTQPDF